MPDLRRACPLRAAVGSMLAAIVMALSGAACGAGVASPSAQPTAIPTIQPDAIAHPTGAAEVVLRYEVGGGFVPIEFIVNHVPEFTLYGDGRAVYLSPTRSATSTPDGITLGPPLRTVQLSEKQVQELLKFALLDGALGRALLSYPPGNVADAPTTTFEIHADSGLKTVSVGALGMDSSGNDAVIRAAFAKLADRLGNFDQGGLLGGADYAPAAYRGVLMDSVGNRKLAVRAWPWPDLPPSAFTEPASGSIAGGRTHVLTPNQVAALGVSGFQGGIPGGLGLHQPDGTIVILLVRPLLPDEKS